MDSAVDLPTFDQLAQQEAEQAEQQQQVQQAVEEQHPPQEDRKIANPNARVRILEREKRELANRLRDLEIKLDRSLASMQREEAEPEEEPAPDIKNSPAEALFHEIKQIKKEVQENKQTAAQQAASRERDEALASVNQRMVEFSNDPILNGALAHLGNIMGRNVERLHPELTSQERLGKAKSLAEDMYVAWIKSGRDPVQETISLAVDYGFQGPVGQQQVAPKGKEAKVDAKAEVAAERERAAATTSLGATQGRSPGKLNVGKLVEGNEDDFVFKVRGMQRDGVVRKGRLGVPSFGDLARAAGQQK